MRLYVWVVLVLVILIFIGSEASANADSSEIDWSKGEPTVISSKDVTGSSNSWCQGYNREIFVKGKWVSACVYDGELLSFAKYYEGGISKQAVRLGYDASFYPLSNVCGNSTECFYSGSTDKLIMNKNVSRRTTRFLSVYENFSKNITKRFDLVGQHIGYEFNLSNPVLPLGSPDQSSTFNPIRALGISKNGRWVAIELYENGIALIDLESMIARRIYNVSSHYGGGYNPSYHMAVSDNGQLVVVAGQNVSSMFIHPRQGCGDLIKSSQKLFKSTRTDCIKGAISTSSISAFGPFRYLMNPILNDDGSRLDIRALTKEGRYLQVSMLAPGSSEPALSAMYIALGDSFTSGEGETLDSYYLRGTNTEGGRCHVSKRSYPYLVASLIGFDVDKTKNVACSGAKIIDVLGSDGYFEQQTNALTDFMPGKVPQIEFIRRYKPQIISIGIGGNNIGFSDKLKSCVMPGTCDWATSSRASVFKEIMNVKSYLSNLYSKLKEASSGSKVLAIGYPQIIETDTCKSYIGIILDKSERQFIYQSIGLLNNVISNAANESGITFVDNSDVFESNKLCQSTNTPAMNGVRFGDDMEVLNIPIIGAESFHPTPYGHQLMASSIGRLLNSYNKCNECIGMRTLNAQNSDYWGDINNAPTAINKTTTQNEIYLTERRIKISLPASSFRPSVAVRIELHSDPIELGEFRAGDDGELEVELTLPDGLTVGYHTLHIYGLSPLGEEVDYYQTVHAISGPVKNDQGQGVRSDKPNIDYDVDNLQYGPSAYSSENGSVLANHDLSGSEANNPITDNSRGYRNYALFITAAIVVILAIITLVFVCWRFYIKS